MTVLAFSPDSAFLVMGCGHKACVLVPGLGARQTGSCPFGGGEGMFAGKSLAMSSYGSGDVPVYDVATWQAASTIQLGAGSVMSVVFSPGGEWLAASDNLGALTLWRL